MKHVPAESGRLYTHRVILMSMVDCPFIFKQRERESEKSNLERKKRADKQEV